MFSNLSRLGAVAYLDELRGTPATWGFCHVPKTAGTSVIAALMKGRPPYHNIYVRDYTAVGDAFRAQEWAVTREFVEQQQNALRGGRPFRSFSGHLRREHVEFIRQQLPGTRFFTLLRDPVQRVISDYRYCLTPAYPAHERFKAEYPTIMDFISDARRQNKMVTYLAESMDGEPKDIIASVLGGFEFVGIMELLHVSMSMISYVLDTKLPIEHENRTIATDRNSVDHDPETLLKIKELNLLDDLLYRTVYGVIEEQGDAWPH